MRNFDPYNTRLVKIPLEISLIRQIDELVVEGIGGYSDRNDFIRDAVSGLLAELHYQSEETPQPHKQSSDSSPRLSSAAASSNNSVTGAIPAGGAPRLNWPAHVTPLERSDYDVADFPLMGLHNRDFPSLWAAAQIAEITADGSWDAEKCFDEVVSRAWKCGKQLAALECPGSQRYSALFPTNEEKRSSSEANFRAFAIGRIVGNGTKKTMGPLFQWRLCGLNGDQKALRIGVLPGAEMLFRQIGGISAESPHSEDHANAFLQHLRLNAPADFDMLMRVIGWISKKPSRQQLIDGVAAFGRNWSPKQANSYTAGYVARAREWGLVESKMIEGTYSLAAFGESILTEHNHEETSK